MAVVVAEALSPYTPHPTPYTLTPSTLHPAPQALHPTPYTLTPYTLHSAWQVGLEDSGRMAVVVAEELGVCAAKHAEELRLRVRVYFSQNVFKVVLQKSTPQQFCQRIIYYD